jgi:Family of unknown function (DUF6339)
VPVIYTPTGGTRIAPTDLVPLANEIRNTARASGYPGVRGQPIHELGRTLTATRDFDISVATLLHQKLAISAHEASRDGVWEFFTSVLLPDVVRWRFPGQGRTVEERFLGGIRNVFGRLWWRAYLLHDTSSDDPYRLLKFLNEDEVVSITERPLLGFSQRIAQITVRAFMSTLETQAKINRMVLMREAQKYMIRFMTTMRLDAMDDSDLASFIGSVFRKTALLPQLARD